MRKEQKIGSAEQRLAECWFARLSLCAHKWAVGEAGTYGARGSGAVWLHCLPQARQR